MVVQYDDDKSFLRMTGCAIRAKSHIHIQVATHIHLPPGTVAITTVSISPSVISTKVTTDFAEMYSEKCGLSCYLVLQSGKIGLGMKTINRVVTFLSFSWKFSTNVKETVL